MTTLIGQQLGRYQIQEEIGRGGMARVYRALDTALQRQVALKVLAPQLALDQEFLRRFEREAITAANLDHPNIVRVFDVGEAGGLRYIAMEYIRGRTLHAIIKERGALGLGYAVGIVAPVAAALDYAHTQGAVHRDVKPQNVLIDISGRVLLADFGIAQGPDGGTGERLTRTGIFMGTPEYISPEQASAQRVDGRSDLYSLGIATYEIITGMVPFTGATPQLIVAHVQATPPLPSTLDSSQPPELDIVLARALAKRPEGRFGTGAAFVEALRIVCRRQGIAPADARAIADLVLPQSTTRPPISAPRPAPPPPPRPTPPRSSLEETRRGPPPLRTPPPSEPAQPPAPAPVSRPDAAWRGFMPYALGAAAALLLVLALAAGRAAGFGTSNATATPDTSNVVGTATSLPTATPLPTETPVPPTATPPPTDTPALPTSTPVPPAPTLAPAAPTLAPAAPTVTPELPTATPELPTATPELPTATPELPTATPEPPTATPEPPTATPEPPTATPEPPTVTPEPPTATPEPPTAAPVIVTIETPAAPTATATAVDTALPSATSALPSATPAASPTP